MGRFLYPLIFSLSFILGYAQKIKIENPVYIVNSLINSFDEDEMEKTYKYYGMNELPSKNGCKIYVYSDGTEFHFNMDTVAPSLKSPVIK